MSSAVPLLTDRSTLPTLTRPTAGRVRRGVALAGLLLVQFLLVIVVVALTLGLAGGGAGVGPDRPPAPVVHPEPGY
jgi:hypothetical protein